MTRNSAPIRQTSNRAAGSCRSSCAVDSVACRVSVGLGPPGERKAPQGQDQERRDRHQHGGAGVHVGHGAEGEGDARCHPCDQEAEVLHPSDHHVAGHQLVRLARQGRDQRGLRRPGGRDGGGGDDRADVDGDRCRIGEEEDGGRAHAQRLDCVAPDQYDGGRAAIGQRTHEQRHARRRQQLGHRDHGSGRRPALLVGVDEHRDPGGELAHRERGVGHDDAQHAVLATQRAEGLQRTEAHSRLARTAAAARIRRSTAGADPISSASSASLRTRRTRSVLASTVASRG